MNTSQGRVVTPTAVRPNGRAPSPGLLRQEAEIAVGGDGPRPAPLGARARAAGRRLGAGGVQKGFLALADQGVVSATGLATSVVIGRLATPAELGIYYLALNIVLFVRGLQEQTISTPYMIYHHRREGAEAAAYAGSCLMHQMALAALTVAGLLVVTHVLPSGFGLGYMSPTLYVLLFAAPILLLREYVRHISFAHLRMGAALGLDVVVGILQIVGLLILARFALLSAAHAYGVIAIACSVAVYAWFWRVRLPMRLKGDRFLSDWRHNWSFGKWAVAGQLVGSASIFLLPWILTHARGTDATGVFAAALTLVGLSNVFMMGVANYLTPKSVRAYATGGVRGLRRVLRTTAFFFMATLGPLFLAVWLVGEPIALMVYGDQYAGMRAVMALLALSFLVNSLGVTASNGLYAMEHIRSNFTADLWMTGIGLAAAVALVYPFGVIGAAWARLIGVTAGVLARNWILLQLMNSSEEVPRAVAEVG